MVNFQPDNFKFISPSIDKTHKLALSRCFCLQKKILKYLKSFSFGNWLMFHRLFLSQNIFFMIENFMALNFYCPDNSPRALLKRYCFCALKKAIALQWVCERRKIVEGKFHISFFPRAVRFHWGMRKKVFRKERKSLQDYTFLITSWRAEEIE